MTTAMKFPAVLPDANASVDDTVVPASLPPCWMSVIVDDWPRRPSPPVITTRRAVHEERT
jgi:hypothetical protein